MQFSLLIYSNNPSSTCFEQSNYSKRVFSNRLRKTSASCWSLLSTYITMHGPENVKLLVYNNVKLPANKIKIFNLVV